MIDICPKIHSHGKCVILDSSEFFFLMERKENELFFFLNMIELFFKNKLKQHNKFMSSLAVKELAVQQGRPTAGD